MAAQVIGRLRSGSEPCRGQRAQKDDRQPEATVISAVWVYTGLALQDFRSSNLHSLLPKYLSRQIL